MILFIHCSIAKAQCWENRLSFKYLNIPDVENYINRGLEDMFTL